VSGTMRRNHGRGHSYLLDGSKVPGVTTILNEGYPKQLTKWAAETAAGYAVDHWDELAEQPPSKRLKAIQAAPYADRDKAANRGTEVHALAEKLVKGEQVEVPDELAGHVESYIRFLDDWDVQPVMVERPVFSRRWMYGGTLDLAAMLADSPGDDPDLIDIKTSRSGIWTEAALQLAAYRFADLFLAEDGTEQPMPTLARVRAVWVRADGYDLLPVDADREQFRIFCYVAQVAQFARLRREDVIGDALRPPARQEVST